MRLRVLLTALSLMLVADAAVALPITFTFGSSLLAAVPGGSATFTGTVADTGNSPTFLNGDAVNVAAPLNPDDTPFFINFPAVLAPLQSVTAPIFVVFVPLGTSPGLYPGVFSLLGGSTDTAFSTLASQSFAVSVVPVPEPGTMVLVLLGMGTARAVKGLRRRSNRSRA